MKLGSFEFNRLDIFRDGHPLSMFVKIRFADPNRLSSLYKRSRATTIIIIIICLFMN